MRIEPIIEEDALRERVEALAESIYRDYADAPLSMLCIAEGARRFVDDLSAHLGRRGLTPHVLEVRVSRTEGTELGPVQVDQFDSASLEGRDVLVVDDIADEGATLRAVHDILETTAEARSVRTAVLIDKRERRRFDLALDYIGFPIERGWVIGYGMDVDGEYRELDWIGVLVDDRF